jgi:hypothetical protein
VRFGVAVLQTGLGLDRAARVASPDRLNPTMPTPHQIVREPAGEQETEGHNG